MMPKETGSSQVPFNLKKLQQLLEMMEKHGVTEIKLSNGPEKWQVRRGSLEPPQIIASSPYPPETQTQAPQASASPPAESTSDSTAKEDGTVILTSPAVGTFYLAPGPDDAPFVKVGDTINEKTTVCIIEAMKVFNKVPAKISGTIVEILAKDGEPVGYNDPLFRVRPN